MKFLARWLATAIAAGVALWIVPGAGVVGDSALIPVILFALVLALINVFIKPVLQFLGAPITILTLGIFYLVINAALLFLAAWLSNGIFGAGIYINSWWSALGMAIVVSIVSAIANGVLGVDDDDRQKPRR